MLKGIDAAKWNGDIVWPEVKDAGVEFAILKVIDESGNMEAAFERNYTGAADQGIPAGVYNYSYAAAVSVAQTEADRVIRTLDGRKPQCKIWMDVEDPLQMGLGKQLIDVIRAYQAVIEEAGHEFGVYTGLSFYNSYIRPYAAMLVCPFWIARYPSSTRMPLASQPAVSKKPSILHPLWGWQYTSTGAVPGISGNVDISIMYAAIATDTGRTEPANPYMEPVYTLYRYRPLMDREYVRWLQYELNEMGYGLAVDGYFGKATDAALRDAQKRLGLSVDGKCGPETRAALKKQNG